MTMAIAILAIVLHVVMTHMKTCRVLHLSVTDTYSCSSLGQPPINYKIKLLKVKYLAGALTLWFELELTI